MSAVPPAPKNLAELGARLREIQAGPGISSEGLSPLQIRVGLALNAVVLFLDGQEDLKGGDVLVPLWTLLTALGDLQQGTSSPLFMPVKRGRRPVTGTQDQIAMAFAASGMDALIRYRSFNKEEGARKIAELLRTEGYQPPYRSNSAPELADTVAGWRDELSRGKRAPPFAAEAWSTYKQAAKSGDLDVEFWLEHIRAHFARQRNLINPLS